MISATSKAVIRKRPVSVLSMVLLSMILYGYGLCIPTAAHADLADQHYKRALQAYESKDYSRAIREFQTAYKVRQLPRILLNIGQVYRKLGMASTALKFYEHYLRIEPHPKPAIKAEVDRYIVQTKAMLDPPDFASLPTGSKAAAAAAAAAVAAAPSEITAPLYSEPYDPQAEGATLNRDTVQPPVPPRSGVPGSAPPGLMLRPGSGRVGPGGRITDLRDLRPLPPPEKPFYKKSWFWGVIGGMAAGAVITGVAVGVTQSVSPPKTILRPQ